MNNWRSDPDDPANRLLLEPKCPQCNEPAYQEALLTGGDDANAWTCSDCGHAFRDVAPLPLSEKRASLDGYDDLDDQ